MSLYRELSDEDLISLFQEGEETAFDELVYRYQDRIINFLFRYTGSYETAEDLAQDTFIKLFKSKHLYKNIAKFSTWFYTIAINTAKTWLKNEGRIDTISINLGFDEDGEKDFDIESRDITPENYANAKLEEYYIQKALAMLDDKFREIIILRDIQDLDYEEIAKITGLPIGTVKSRINRAREKLKNLLQEIYQQNSN
ncbi:MAG: RNA polymerase sigma factor [Ignavibacteria bacterium]